MSPRAARTVSGFLLGWLGIALLVWCLLELTGGGS